jgi:hypothetical protein
MNGSGWLVSEGTFGLALGFEIAKPIRYSHSQPVRVTTEL